MANKYNIPIFISDNTTPSPYGITAHEAKDKVKANTGDII